MSPQRSSSRRWLNEHAADPYVREARRMGYRCRSAFKLKEIQERDRVMRPGQRVLDLGAAPGGWSQYASGIVGNHGLIVAVDRLAISPMPGVLCLEADLESESAVEAIRAAVGGESVDVVLSDMAPNASGHRAMDQPRAMGLAELARETAEDFLRPGGNLVIKLFQGEGFEAFIEALRRDFERVAIRNPRASRSASRETYAVARNYKV